MQTIYKAVPKMAYRECSQGTNYVAEISSEAGGTSTEVGKVSPLSAYCKINRLHQGESLETP